jgi:hypothetical protein
MYNLTVYSWIRQATKACFFVVLNRLSNIEEPSISISSTASQYLKGGL